MSISRRQFELTALAALLGDAAARGQQAGQAPSAPRPSVPWLNEVQTPPATPAADEVRLGPLLIDLGNKPIATRAAWVEHRMQIRQRWRELLGAWEPPPVAPQFEIVETERIGAVSRRLIRYETEPGWPVEAYLLVPRGAESRPGVIVLHSTVDYTIRQPAGLEGPDSAAWGLKLAQRGIVALCPRCFLWDGSSTVNYKQRVTQHHARHPRATGMAKMLFDALRAVDLLARLPEVDRQRLGAAGHSLGAKQALYLAAFDDRIKATVFSEGGIGLAFSNWEAPWYLGTRQWEREHHELLGLIAPRACLLVGGNSADGARSWPYVASALEVYRLFGAPYKVGLYNHGQGHTIPPPAESRVYEWLQTYL